MNSRRLPNLRAFQQSIGYTFKNTALLELALTHSSYKNELKAIFPHRRFFEDNERLEFLGDAILSLIISKQIFTTFKTSSEGQLSKYRAILVSKESLFKIAKEIKLVRFLRLGKGEASGTIEDKSNILANALEALIAAIYLDGGLKYAERFVVDYFGEYINPNRLSRLDKNYKSMLQEYSQKTVKTLPAYTTIQKKDRFQATVSISRSKKGTGWGRSKREAEQEAARHLLKKLKK